MAETFGHAIFGVPQEEDGSAGAREEVARLPGALPDGLAFYTAGNLLVACYGPSQVLRVVPEGTVVCLIRNEETRLFCHPTNLGRWRITAVER